MKIDAKNLRNLFVKIIRTHVDGNDLIGTYFLRGQIYTTNPYVGNYLTKK